MGNYIKAVQDKHAIYGEECSYKPDLSKTNQFNSTLLLGQFLHKGNMIDRQESWLKQKEVTLQKQKQENNVN